MNRDQATSFAVGSAAMGLFCLHPPMREWTDTVRSTSWAFHSIFERSTSLVLEVPAYLAGIVIVALATANAMVQLRTRRDP